jgi:hypothetical protein
MDLPGQTNVDGSEQRTRRPPSLWRMDFTLKNLLILFATSLLGLFIGPSPPGAPLIRALVSRFTAKAPFPRPHALSPPAPPRGLATPSHYTFSGLSVITDLVDIALAKGQIGTRVQSLPCVHRGVSDKMWAALLDLEVSARVVQN